MSLGVRGFIEYLVEKIDKEGTLSEGYSERERTEDVVKMIWESYDRYEEGDD